MRESPSRVRQSKFWNIDCTIEGCTMNITIIKVDIVFMRIVLLAGGEVRLYLV